MPVNVNVTKTAKISGSSLTLKDLRELVKICEGMREDARVTPYQSGTGYYIENTNYSITVAE